MPNPFASRLAQVLVLLAAPAVLAVPTAVADPAPHDRPAAAATQDRPVAPGREDRARGLVWAGLGATSPGDPCTNLLRADVPGAAAVCSHGPDPAPEGVDVTQRRTAAELAAATATTSTTTAASGGTVCDGDGVTGNRVQVLYVRAADVADRWADLAPLVPAWLASTESVYVDSAAETGGVRHLRWVHDAACAPVVQQVQVSSTGDDTFSNTVSELKALGWSRTDRKYLLLVDANVYCGIGSVRGDDTAGSANANNTGGSYARVDNGCWGQTNSVEAHELMHNLGGVQLSAPHTSGGWHCTDDNDRMCYADSTSVTMTYVCDSSHERLFDCGHDDYFSTAPPTGSYLATHWNAADSAFLVGQSSSTPTASPAATTTTTFTGKMSRKTRVRTHALTAGAGPLTGSLSFSGASSMRAELLDSAGRVLTAAEGASPVQLSTSVAGGSYTVRLTSPGFPTYSMPVTYTTG